MNKKFLFILFVLIYIFIQVKDISAHEYNFITNDKMESKNILTDKQKELLQQKRNELKEKYFNDLEKKSFEEKQKAFIKFKEEMNKYCKDELGISCDNFNKGHHKLKKFLP